MKSGKETRNNVSSGFTGFYRVLPGFLKENRIEREEKFL